MFLSSLDLFRYLPSDTLVLPSHDWPFLNLFERIDDLIAHHKERLEVTYEICSTAVTALDVQKQLFRVCFGLI